MAEQQKRPGADISDLKARLGLKQPAGAPPSPAAAPRPTGSHAVMPQQPGAAPGRAAAPAGVPAASRPPAAAPASHGVSPTSAPRAAAPSAAAPSAAAAKVHDPFAAMKPQAGAMFDLRTIDDGRPVESVQAKGGKGGMIITGIVGLIAFGVGAGFGGAAIGRKAYNSANVAAKAVKVELDSMQKTLTQIGTALNLSQQRLAAEKKDAVAYDPKLIDELKTVKLDPRPDTNKIFRVNYYLLEDMVVDRLFNYYYDSIALYGEVERHIKKTDADKETLKAAADKAGTEAQKTEAKYGVVFDTAGKLTVANLVEVGKVVCKSGGEDCPNAADMEGFEVRAGLGSAWYKRKVASKSDGERVVPLKPTPLMDAVMSGSPDQVRVEAYRQRVANLRGVAARLSVAQKELFEGVNKSAGRPDLFTLF